MLAMVSTEYDLDEVCDLLIFGANGGVDTLEDLHQWFDGLATYHSGQLSQKANHIVNAAIGVLDQMIYEKACLACQYCPSRPLTTPTPACRCVTESTTHNQMERRLLSQLSILAM